MANFNTYKGFVGGDIKITTTKTGKTVAKFSLGVQNGNNTTMWLRITVWDVLAKNLQGLIKKGDYVWVEGYFTCDKETGGPQIYNSKASFDFTASAVAKGIKSWEAKTEKSNNSSNSNAEVDFGDDPESNPASVQDADVVDFELAF